MTLHGGDKTPVFPPRRLAVDTASDLVAFWFFAICGSGPDPSFAAEVDFTQTPKNFYPRFSRPNSQLINFFLRGDVTGTL